MLIAALFIIVKTRKQSQYPLGDKQTSKMWYIIRNAKTCTNLKDIVSKNHWTQKQSNK